MRLPFLPRRIRKSPPRCKPRRTTRLGLEALEDRLAPALMVTSALDDGGAGTLRSVINNAPAGSTIQFAANVQGQTITLTQGEIGIGVANLTIDGGSGVTIDAQGKSRIFDITSIQDPNETIKNLALNNGSAPGTTEDAPGLGGAIYTWNSLTLTNDSFTNDTAAKNGGAVYDKGWNSGGTLTVSGSTFRSDTAGLSGGAIFVADANNTLTMNVALTSDGFITNQAGTSGGAVFASGIAGSTLNVTGSTFDTNKVTGSGDGGAIFTTDKLNLLYQAPGPGNLFENNVATNGGGAIAYEPLVNSWSSMQVTNATFYNNTAESGAGVYANVNTNSGQVTVTITGSLFNANQAIVAGQQSNYGGGIYVNASTSGSGSSSVSITNSTFYHNTSEANGGGIALNLSNTGTGTNTAQFTSLTVYQNAADTAGGGMWVNLSGTSAVTVHLDNSIVAGDTIGGPSTNGPDVFFAFTGDKSLLQFISGGQPKSGYNFIGIGDGGVTWWVPTNNVGTAANPKVPALDPNGLQSNGGPTQTIKLLTTDGGGYHLGDPSLAGTLDQRGYTRPNNGALVSIGAYDPDATQ